MLPVGDKPILELIVENLKRNKVRQLVLATAYLGRQIEDYFGDGSDFGVDIQYARSKKPLGTAGQLKTAEALISGTFLAMNGDILIDVNIPRLVQFHRRMGGVGTITLRHYRVPVKYGVISMDKANRITEWTEKPQLQRVVNMGLYVLEPEVFSYIKPKSTISLEMDTFPYLIRTGKTLYGYLTESEYYDVADVDDLKRLATRSGASLGYRELMR
jgi:NDP-sugar pyrophosphorylase family protein